jgi:hypothetical protein
VARTGTAEHVERIVRGWRRVDRQAEIRETARHDATRALHVYPDDDGTVVVRGRLTPEAGALLLRALDAARETLYQQARGTGAAGAVQKVSAETPTFPQQQADALALLAETSQRLACDASRVVMREDAEGRLVEIGARTRTIPPQSGERSTAGTAAAASPAAESALPRDITSATVSASARTR